MFSGFFLRPDLLISQKAIQVLEIALFSTHSLRAGGASAAANAGVADRLFQRHGKRK